MSGLSKFRCLACGASFPLSGARIACNACGGLLDVVSELRAFGRTGETWRELFDRRRAAGMPAVRRKKQQSIIKGARGRSRKCLQYSSGRAI